MEHSECVFSTICAYHNCSLVIQDVAPTGTGKSGTAPTANNGLPIGQVALRIVVYCYHTSRNHLSSDKDPPVARPVEPVEAGKVVTLPRVGGLHHHYTRLAT